MNNNLPVIMCIGSVNVSGDSLGPLVGDILSARLRGSAYVYGTTENPVNGVNLRSYVEYVKTAHEGSFVIGIDASVGAKADVGKIKVAVGGVRAGGALKRDLPTVGDIGIIGIVAERGTDNLGELMAVPFKSVEKLGKKIAKKTEGLIHALNFASRRSA